MKTRTQCSICGIFTTNIRKHLARNRCKQQHKRKHKKENPDNVPSVFA